MQGSPFQPSQFSGNWSGYVVPSSSVVTQASGRFTVPLLNCTVTPDADVTTWVGTGGFASSDPLLQTGVWSFCSGGVQVDDPAWWEVVPPLPAQAFNSMHVTPGDQIQASVWQAGDGSWVTRVDDLTTGISGEMQTGNAWGTISDSNPNSWLVQEGDASTVSYSGGFTAEWIVEDGTNGSTGQLDPFADFGIITFSDLTTEPSLLPLTPSEETVLYTPDQWLLAIPSAPSGSGFSVSYTG
jgi:Peptidase A4 family